MRIELLIFSLLFMIINYPNAILPQSQISLIELCSESDEIIVAEITHVESSYNDSNGRITSTIFLRVENHLKSLYLKNVKEFQMIYPGGEYGEIYQIIPDAPRFIKNEKTILFLKQRYVGNKNFFEFAVKELKPLIKNKPGLCVVLLELETHQEVIHGNIDKAMKNLDLIINKYNLDEYTDKYTLFRIGSFYIHFYSDIEKAEKIFNQIISKYPNDPLIEEISFLMNTPVYKGQIASNTIIEVTDKVKEEYRIENYPNPFNPTTTIRYQISKDGLISLKTYDMLGREVADLVNDYKKAGEHTVNFDGSKLSSGVYIYKLVGNNVNISKKMILMK